MAPTQVHRVFVFGSQALAFDDHALNRLHLQAYESPDHSWSLDAISNLPAFWNTLAKTLPTLEHLDGERLLQELSRAIETGETSQTLFPLPNILLSPLVVITQLTQYIAFLKGALPGLADDDELPSTIREHTETLGLCTGILSSFAVSCSSTLSQLQDHGRVAVRLAMLAGALVDAEEKSPDSDGLAASISVAWNGVDALSGMGKILEQFPEAYTSVFMDEKRSTITTSQRTTSALIQQLKQSSVHVTPISGLAGRFHCIGHQENLDKILQFCDITKEFQLPDVSAMVLPSRLCLQYASTESLHRIALREILVNPARWLETFSDTCASQANEDLTTSVFCFGPERCVPPTQARKLGSHLVYVSETDPTTDGALAMLSDSSHYLPFPKRVFTELPDDRIAVVGMSCQVPGAEDINAFWEILTKGESQHIEVPQQRFAMATPFRDVAPGQKWYGNFISDHDAFDHKFFKKSPREMASTDPQQRVMFQLAYQAIEQSGYFGSSDHDPRIGCYIGLGNVDYDRNISCSPATAYSATGNLRSFAAGKISHYFGFTGPSLTIDTACSSSSVAIHQACRAIINGECTSALAGGVNILTNPEWFHNLAGASFLSPTGQCKPFDAKGDGYCRGEGAGIVYLKRLSSALADGDQIMGVIAATKVYQNQNCTAITVPNAASLSELFVDVVHQARLEPQTITVVEAHGTGTQAGDPAEYDAVRRALGGSVRTDKLSLSSVKGLVGHAEFASGVISLIKVLLMVNEGYIPPQASFTSINPALKALSTDKIEIPTHMQPWNVKFRAALINNYGASGSNASMVITQAPRLLPSIQNTSHSRDAMSKFPFWLCGVDAPSIRAHAVEVQEFLQSQNGSKTNLGIANMSYQLARQSNRSLSHALIFSATSSDDLTQKLSDFQHGGKDLVASKLPPSRPVILCFGGQISTFVGLSKDLYQQVTILQYYLDLCNSTCLSLGLGSIYPAIFQTSPVQDVVMLQVILFATQYSCAKSWIDCGIKVAAIVGHSFGELTGLCISGVYSLADALKVISDRARIIRDHWASDKGAMLAVEANHADVIALIEMSKAYGGLDVSIACYNGPRSFTLGGSKDGVQSTYNLIKSNPRFSKMRSKLLNVTNAFHSALVDPLMHSLRALGQEITLSEPVIPIERAIETKSSEKLQHDFIAQHLRNPVYFNNAVQRISEAHPNAIWLEAGSNSTVMTMVSRALAGLPSDHHFQAVNISSGGSSEHLVNTTTTLWEQGLNVVFWAHHAKQALDYSVVLLPPYRFEKSRHWLDLKQLPKAVISEAEPVHAGESPKTLTTLVAYRDEAKRSARFRVNTMLDRFKRLIPTKTGVGIAITPDILHLEVILDALMKLQENSKKLNYEPEIRNIVYHNTLRLESFTEIYVDVQCQDATGSNWKWQLHSTDAMDNAIEFSSGEVLFQSATDSDVEASFAFLSRLSSRTRCVDLLQNTEADEVLQGRSIYRALESITNYKDDSRRVSKIVAKNNESGGLISKPYCRETWMDPILTECFCQVAGIFINLLTDPVDLSEEGVFICKSVSKWIRNPGLATSTTQHEYWEVFAVHHRESEARYVSDVFAFDPRDGTLFEAILGMSYERASFEPVPSSSIRSLSSESQLFTPAITISEGSQLEQQTDILPRREPASTPTTLESPYEKKIASKSVKSVDLGLSIKTRGIISNLSGLELEEINDESDLVELGIDSLMAIELVREVYAVFKCTLQNDQLMDLTDMRSLVSCIRSALGFDEAGKESLEDLSSLDAEQLKLNDVGLIDGIDNAKSAQLHDDYQAILSPEIVRGTFHDVKWTTDDFIIKGKLSGYFGEVIPRSTELCIAHIIDAFEQLGCPIRTAAPHQKLKRVPYLPRHEQFMTLIYKMLEKDSRLIDINGTEIKRTAVAPPLKSAKQLLEALIHDEPAHAAEHRLTYLVGVKFANLITGKEDGLQLIFGTPESREITTDMYSKSPINTAWITQLESFLGQLIERLPGNGQPICILEIGAGTGGTTSRIIPLLAKLGVPVKYVMTDISSSLVAAARRRFKQYPFMEFKVVNMENEPDQRLLDSQHIILATNCVHATRDLSITLKNLHRCLRPDGFLIMLEMTDQVPCFDFVFGLLEGWWLYEDGRDYALQPVTYWERVLHAAGYGHVDWTEGNLPEANIQRLIIAHASGPKYAHKPNPHPQPVLQDNSAENGERRTTIESIVRKYTTGFQAPTNSTVTSDIKGQPKPSFERCVLVTGATGSLGAHIVASLVQRSDVHKVVCLNRLSSSEPEFRQRESLNMRGISLSDVQFSKISVIETDASKPMLGLSLQDYRSKITEVTDIVHSAWAMSLTRPIRTYESQFKIARNLIDFAREVALSRPASFKFGFQFVSSAAVVANYPSWTGSPLVPEQPGTIASLPATGYAEAKLVVEQMLAATLYQYPNRFHAMITRIAQISGSTSNGYWNPSEYMPFLIKSSQVLKCLPYLDGDLSWCPVDCVAATLVELLVADTATDLVYHIDNPSRQSWQEMITTLASALGIESDNIVPYDQWVNRVRRFKASTSDNPALQLIGFFENYFVPMSCGGLILDTQQTRKYSETLRLQEPVGEELILKYVSRWIESGFLNS